MFCKICGTNIPAGTKFCPNCGQPVETEAETVTYTVPTDSVQPAPAPRSAGNGTGKSKLVAGLLGIFVGALGVHNFYLGNTKRGLLQLLVTVLTCGIGGVAMEIWGLIEGIFYLMGKEGYTTDANGNPLTD